MPHSLRWRKERSPLVLQVADRAQAITRARETGLGQDET
jgi:hypothetical protein